MRVAAAKYAIGRPADFEAFAARQRALLGEAARAGAQVVVLPEYLALELAATFDAAIHADLHASLAAIQGHRDAWCALYADLARTFGMVVQPGTFLLDRGDGRYRNRADWFAPDGRRGHQDKLQLTAFEKQAGVIDGGDRLHVVDLGRVRAGIAVCYDAEFPLPVRSQVEAGARLLLVPSCTDTEAGATRVRVGCLARALEGRMFVAQAVTAGTADWSPALDVNTGEAAIHAPMDRGLPDDGVLARAQVANDRDWPGQLRPGLVRATLAGGPAGGPGPGVAAAPGPSGTNAPGTTGG